MMSSAKVGTRYAVAVSLTAAAFAVRWPMGSLADRPILTLFCIPILLSALLGGAGPGLLVTFLVALGTTRLVLPRQYGLDLSRPRDLVTWLLLCLFGILASVLPGVVRRSIRNRADGQLHFQAQILRNVNDAVVAVDADKRIIFWGEGAETLYGIPARDAIGKRYSDLYTLRWSSPAGPADYEAALAARGFFRGETVHVLPSGRELHVEATVTVLKDPQGRVTGRLGVLRDIGERKRVERESAAVEARLRAALGILEMALFSQDRDLRYTWVYQPQLLPPQEVLGTTDYQMLERLGLPDINKVIAAKRHALQTGIPSRTEIRFGEGASARWYNLAIEPIRDAQGTVVGITCASLDISESKRVEERLRRSEEELRALAARLQSIREDEQTRIARDLHDELGQALTALKMQLRSLETRTSAIDPENVHGVLDRVVAASELIDETLATVRRIATGLRPGSLDRLGLVPTVRQEMRRFEMRTGIRCEASLPEQLPDLKPEMATALYRIWQEAMTNVQRHSKASRVAVRIAIASGRITLQVEDDGQGFDPVAVSSPHALGLLGMVERAKMLDGHVHFQRGAQTGTLVTASIPITVAAPVAAGGAEETS
jgi:PAS domain S-box-containing protein